MKLRFAGCVYAAILLIDGATGLLAQEKTFELGLGIATIAACGGFAAISGSSAATAATFSAVAYPEMRRFGYPQRDVAHWARCCLRQQCSPSTALLQNRISVNCLSPVSSLAYSPQRCT